MIQQRDGDLARAAGELLAWTRTTRREALADVVGVLGQLGEPALAREVAPLADHPDGEVRLVVAQALGRLLDPSPATVAALVRLSRDCVADVRSWATFALADEALRDAPGVVEALVSRLDDPAGEVRVEAVRGLAARGDARAVEVAFELAPAWSADPTFRQAIERLSPPERA